MGPLALQIMILVSSFLFYRILKSGFDSWRAVILDFGIIMFLFGLQYYLQKKQNMIENQTNDSLFPSNSLSTFLGVNFPTKIALNKNVEPKAVSLRPMEQGSYLQLTNDVFIEPMQKKILQFTPKLQENQMWKNNKIQVNDGFYIVQITCHVDMEPYMAKLTLKGEKNEIEKTIHDGENSFIVHFNGQDQIYFEIENFKNNIMFQETTTLYLIKL